MKNIETYFSKHGFEIPSKIKYAQTQEINFQQFLNLPNVHLI